jgi:hypothetical protein
MGVTGYDGMIAHDLYLKLKHGIEFFPKENVFGSDEEEFESLSDDIRRGNLYEPFAIQFAAKDLELGVDYATDKDDGIRRFSRSHPVYSYIGAMPDCQFADSWIGEAKCPRPHMVRKQVEEGPNPKFIWQMTCQAACYPEAPGVRFIIYDCVSCRSYVYGFPRETLNIRLLEERCSKFWERHIIGDEPFDQTEWEEPCPLPVFDPLKTSDYVEMQGVAWKEAARRFVAAKVKRADGEFQYDGAKQLIIDCAVASNLSKVKVDGHKFLVKQASRMYLDKRALKEDHPDLELEKYNKQGQRFWELRHYPPRALKGRK